MVKDMTKGAVTPILLKFSLPLLISVVFQQMYNISDSIIAGQCIDKLALAAIGVSYPISLKTQTKCRLEKSAHENKPP